MIGIILMLFINIFLWFNKYDYNIELKLNMFVLVLIILFYIFLIKISYKPKCKKKIYIFSILSGTLFGIFIKKGFLIISANVVKVSITITVLVLIGMIYYEVLDKIKE